MLLPERVEASMTSSVPARRGLSLLALGVLLVAARAGSADLKTKAAPALDPAWMDKTCSACDDFNRLSPRVSQQAMNFWRNKRAAAG